MNFHILCDNCTKKYCIKHRLALICEAIMGRTVKWKADCFSDTETND